MEINEIINYLKRVEGMAKIGLSYTENPYDQERYEELKTSTHDLLAQLTNFTPTAIAENFEKLDAYPTPKVDVRGLIIKEGKVLLIQEKVDRCWSMPGGWCDIGYSPKENVEKEVFEESGYMVQAVRLLTVWDKKYHNHPPELAYVYKLNFLCDITGGSLKPGHEALNAEFFDINELPELSLPRNTKAQIQKLYQLSLNKDEQTNFD
ncbi:MAG: NUDIX hydrolase N-terminal domain-containing protein [Cyclobacteriaceae bacterium]